MDLYVNHLQVIRISLRLNLITFVYNFICIMCYSRYFAFFGKKKVTLMSMLFALFCVFDMIWRSWVIGSLLRFKYLM